MKNHSKSLIFALSFFVSVIATAQNKTTVYFQFDRYDLMNEARSSLDSIVASPNLLSVDIYGHCDQLGSKEYNYRLSEKRAEAVKEYLMAKGLNETLIKIVKGLGEDQPVINKLDEQSRSANRRVIINWLTSSKNDSVNKTSVDSVSTNKTIAPPQDKVKLVEKISDTATKAGQNIVLKNINFYGGSHVFLPQSYPALQDLLEAMQKLPTLVIEIQGHICCVTGPDDGMDNDTGEPILSYNRAKAVYQFLVTRGIDKKRMTFVGFGHQYPIYETEQNEEERTANRRVEIKIIRK